MPPQNCDLDLIIHSKLCVSVQGLVLRLELVLDCHDWILRGWKLNGYNVLYEFPPLVNFNHNYISLMNQTCFGFPYTGCFMY